MDEKVGMLHKICKALMEELEDYSKRIEKTDGMSAGDLEAIDKLSHALKSIKTTIAMMEADDGYSERYMPYFGGMSYTQGGNRGGSGRGGQGGESSYARGGRRGMVNNPTGRNQYSREGGYSYADGMDELLNELRGMMDMLPDDKRREVERFVDKMDRM